MRRGRPCRNTGGLRYAFPALLILAALSAPGSSAVAALIKGNYQIDYNQDVTTTGADKTNIRKFKQTLELKFKGFLSPVVENEVTFKVEQEINSNAADTTRILPALDLGFKGRYWDVKAGGKRTHENSDEPGKNPKTADSWFVEFFYLPRARVPDLKAKYTLDTDFEEGVTDTVEHGIALSSVYKPTEWLEVKGDYSRDTMDDRLVPDSDTEEEKSSGAVGIRRLISAKIKADVEYSVEATHGATLLDAGGSTNTTEDQTHKVKSLLTYQPFRDTSLDGSYDYELKQNLVNGEHVLTTNIKASAGQRIGTPFDVKGEFLRIVTENRHTVDDNKKTEDTWTLDLKANFSKQLDFSFRHEDKHIVEDHVDITKYLTNTTINDTASWTGVLAPFWKASASYDRIDTYLWDTIALREVKATIDKKYSLKSTFDFKAINLTLDPTYDITMKDDFVKSESTETRDFKFKVVYKVLSTRSVEAKIDHTYGRKTDSGAGNVQRTDNSNGSVAWKDALPGLAAAIDLTRSATDTSGDADPADITSTYGFKIDYKYEWLAMNTSYKYDMKSLTDDSETFDAKVGWTAPRWDISLTYTFDKVFSAELDEKYSITFLFKYNL